ncbi:LysR substrate-binding domain-containing protein [Paraburkholderia sp. CNPSo 3274]|uniref:LysR substrate-binding domain-containing protein n=1 Tax=Paraburkholderia sp. CNPSo 3274 TaxID=2940932 RepID=UPI0020B76964|nr:LysR substrate-binding domain-containing protein [Paraburkholderia sp. CNPSo 3274]MCP3710932.1 LysR substrate-binding domain-containing protein [Paraburkholderia sp. CNPSo 3274]
MALGQVGKLHVALTSSAAFHPLAPAVIRAYRDAHPDIAIELSEINAAEIIEMMMNGHVDAGACNCAWSTRCRAWSPRSTSWPRAAV